MKGKRILLALGGNAIKRRNDRGTASEMIENLKTTCDQLAKLVKAGNSLSLTHGNGPQVGQIYLRNQRAAKEIPAWSLNLCVAESEGLLGYLFQQQFSNALHEIGVSNHDVLTLVTQTEVLSADPAFQSPTKPVGHFYTEKEAQEKMRSEPNTVMKEDSGKGWRVVVPSPKPVRIVESRAIQALSQIPNTVLIASGGGGIPVIFDSMGISHGCDAVVDKDSAAVLLSFDTKADLLMLVTDVECCYENYGKETQKAIHKLSIKEARRLLAEGHFKEGSMKPKVEACCEFVSRTSHPAVITSLDKVTEALETENSIGTWFYK